MNFCTKCQSIYAQPGTCNCFASTAPSIQPAPGVVPITPSVPYVPTYQPYTPWWQSPWWTTTTTTTLPIGTQSTYTSYC